MSEWISIEDQIPDEHEPVIISGWNFNNEEKGRFVEPAVRVGMDFWPPFERDEGLVKILIMEGRPFFHPTHWMPMPAAPGETAQPAAEQPSCASDSTGSESQASLSVVRETQAAEQPATVKVPRELAGGVEKLQRYEESCMEGGGVAPSSSGEFVLLSDVRALLAGGAE